MKVILQENVENLGYVGDILDVADGYARNFLLPRKKALEANTRSTRALEHAKRVAAHKAKQVFKDLKDIADKLSKVELYFPVQTGKDDKLFGSVTSKDLEEGLLAQGFEINRRKIQLGQPLKELGSSKVSIKLHRDVVTEITVSLLKKDGEPSPSADAGVSPESVETSLEPISES